MHWFLNLKMRAKLLSAFLVVVALAAVVGAVGLKGLIDSGRALHDLEQEHILATLKAESLRSIVLDVGRLYRQVILDDGAPVAHEHAASVRAQVAAVRTTLDQLGALKVDAEAKTLVGQIRDIQPDWSQRVEETVRLAESGDVAGARAAAAANGTNAAAIAKTLASVSEALQNDTARALRETRAAQDRAVRLMVVVLVAVLVLGVGMGLWLAGVIARPVREAAGVLGRVAEGDLVQSLQLDTHDELGDMARALNAAVTSMRESLLSVQHTAHDVSAAATQLSAASQSISAGAQEQASSLEETAASLEQMTSVVQQNAGNAQDAAQLARETHDTADKGGATVTAAVGAMAEIGVSSRRIADIITTIDEIAFQTNLLALNAAVEAARAGDQGRGFAVVASEVRNLAQRAASSAREIKSLIQDSVAKVDAGTQLVNASGTLLQDIVRSVSGVSEVVTQIATSSREQSAGIEQVNTAITQMDAVTQANASQTEELAGTAEGLASQANQLTALVQRFRLGTGSAQAPGREAAAPPPALALAPAAPRAAVRTGTHGGFEEF